MEIFFYDPKHPTVDMLELDADLCDAGNIQHAVSFVPETRSTSITIHAFQPPGRDESSHVPFTSRTIWEWVASSEDFIGMTSSLNRHPLRQRALQLYVKYSGDSWCYDADFMASLSDRLLEQNKVEDAAEIANFCVTLADSQYKPTDGPSLVAKSKLAPVLFRQGRYSEALQNSRDAVQGLRIECANYHSDLLEAECQLADILIELGESKQAESLCREIFTRSDLLLASNDAILSCEFQLAKSYNALENFQEAREILEHVAAERQKELGSSAELTLRVKDELTRSLQGLGSPEAIALCADIERTIQLKELDGKPRGLWTVRLTHFVARHLHEFGDYFKAERCFSDELILVREKLGTGNHIQVAYTQSWIANSLFNQGKKAKAMTLFEQCLEVFRNILGPFHRNTLISLSNLTWASENMLTFMEFEAKMCSVRDLKVQHLGENDLDTIDSQLWCAQLMARRGQREDSLATIHRLHNAQTMIPASLPRLRMRYEHAILIAHSRTLLEFGHDTRAEELLKKGLILGKQIFGLGHPDALDGLHDLIPILNRMSRYSEADTLILNAISELKRNIDDRHPKILDLELLRADNLIWQKQYAEAETIESQVFRECSAIYGETHPTTIEVAARLAKTYNRQNRITEAQYILEKAIKSSQSTHGPHHRYTCFLQVQLVSLFHENKCHLVQALELSQNVSKTLKTSFGTVGAQDNELSLQIVHPAAVGALEAMASVLHALGAVKESASFFSDALIIRTKVQGPTHQQTMRALKDLAACQKSLRDYERAKNIFRQLVSLTSKVYGKTHTETITAKLDLGNCLTELKEFSECEEMYNEILRGLFDQGGKLHDDVARTYKSMAFLYWTAGRTADAERYMQEAIRILKGIKSHRAAAEMVEFGIFYDLQKNFSKAQLQWKEASCYLGRTVPAPHSLTRQIQLLVAESLCSNKQFDEADSVMEQLRQDFAQREGLQSKNLLKVERLLAKSMHARGRTKDAVQFIQESIRRRDLEELMDPKFWDLVKFLDDLEKEQGREGETTTFLVLEYKLLDKLQDHPKLPSMSVAEIWHLFGCTELAFEHYGNAECCLRAALELRTNLSEVDNAQTIEIEKSLACCIVEPDRLDERLSMQNRLLVQYQTLTKVDPEALIDMERDIAETLYLSNEFQKEVEVRRRILDQKAPGSIPDQQHIWDLQSLARAYFDLEQNCEAELYLDQTLNLIEQKFSEHAEDLCWTLDILVQVRIHLKKMVEAEDASDQAVLLSKQHPNWPALDHYKRLHMQAFCKKESQKWTEVKKTLTALILFVQSLPENARPSTDVDVYERALQYANSMLDNNENENEIGWQNDESGEDEDDEDAELDSALDVIQVSFSQVKETRKRVLGRSIQTR
jgi:tetratricopeptide (TPR) repeat protein